MCKASVLPEFYKISSVSSHNEQLQKITGASENGVDTRIENGTGEGTIMSTLQCHRAWRNLEYVYEQRIKFSAR